MSERVSLWISKSSGANVRQVQAAAGHKSLQTTQRYLGWNVEELRTAMEGRRYSPGQVVAAMD